MQAMAVAEVQAALDALGLGITVCEFECSTATAQQAADNVGCALFPIALDTLKAVTRGAFTDLKLPRFGGRWFSLAPWSPHSNGGKIILRLECDFAVI